ncbi:MAG TPA: amino acid permease [Steroidobacteraceae bacterium]|jgi:APA family basic amino acid/polyamine antiporter|nr:amino acid permease [Steroidobacteraceae bacterium]
MSAPALPAAARAELARDLKLSHAGAIVVGTIIGSGIFLVPSEMMQAVGSARMVYLVWLVGGLLSFFGALTYAELGAMKPQAGGEYVYVRDAYGPLAAFLYSWTWFLIAKPASIATITTGLVRILGTFSVFSFFPHPCLSHPFVITYGQLVAIAAAVLVSWLNYIGVRRAGDFQFVFTLLKVVIILGIVAVGFSYSGGGWSNFGTEFTGAKGGVAGFFAALVAALWAYDGWNDLNMVAGEIREPQRNIPLSLIWGVAVVGALYILVNAAVQYVLPAAAVAASERPASDAVALVLGRAGALLVSAGMAVSMLVTLNGTIMSGARVPFATARDGYFFKAIAEVHPRYRTPAVSIVVQCALAVILLLIGGSFRQFFSLAIFAEWLFYMIAGSTLFVFRRREPLAERPYRVWGYPVVPAIFVAVSAALLYYTFTDNLANSTWGCVAILAGVPVFYFFARRRRTVAEL